MYLFPRAYTLCANIQRKLQHHYLWISICKLSQAGTSTGISLKLAAAPELKFRFRVSSTATKEIPRREHCNLKSSVGTTQYTMREDKYAEFQTILLIAVLVSPSFAHMKGLRMSDTSLLTTEPVSNYTFLFFFNPSSFFLQSKPNSVISCLLLKE